MDLKKCRYDYRILGNNLIIIDLKGILSVTNCIEDIVDLIINKHNTGFTNVYYRDSMNEWDKFDYKNGVFQSVNQYEKEWLKENIWR